MRFFGPMSSVLTCKPFRQYVSLRSKTVSKHGAQRGAEAFRFLKTGQRVSGSGHKREFLRPCGCYNHPEPGNLVVPPQSTDIRVIYALIFSALLFLPISSAQTQTPVRIPATQAQPAQRNDEGAEAELSEGIRLTRQGRFRDAIPHL